MEKYTIKIKEENVLYDPKQPLDNDIIEMLKKALPSKKERKKVDWKVYKKEFWQDLIPTKRKSQYSDIKEIQVSDSGQVRIKDIKKPNEWREIELENDPNYPDGYLRLKGYASLGHVYRMVARAHILGDAEEPRDDKGKLFPIHHIDNNGYNNSKDNLMYVSPTDHAKIHSLTSI